MDWNIFNSMYDCNIDKSFYGIAFLLIAISGFYIAYTIRRKSVFRIKMLIVYILPCIVALSYFSKDHGPMTGLIFFPLNGDPPLEKECNESDDCRQLVILTFIILNSILYYREIKLVMTREGYHKNVLGACMKTVQDAIVTTDQNGKITYTNDAMKKMFKIRNGSDVFGLTIREVLQMQTDKGHTLELYKICEEEYCKVNKVPYTFYQYGEIDGKFSIYTVVHDGIYSSTGMRIGTISVIHKIDDTITKDSQIFKIITCKSVKEAKKALKHHKDCIGDCPIGITWFDGKLQDTGNIRYYTEENI